ncbi:hypothetical protein [Streptomyces sp. NPDC007063]|uniref:hypothetical protein n=1 Tax=Streptomyces sp. NPDC007063 TaxID=3364772 RepID=UPI0036C752CD
MAFTTPTLLPAASSDFESGSHGWTAGANTSLGTTSVAWVFGTRSMTVVANSAGTISATSPRVAVSEGVTHILWSGIRPSESSAGKVATLSIDWYDAPTGGTLLGTSEYATSMPAANSWQYCGAFGDSPVGAVSAAVRVKLTGAPASQGMYVDGVYLAPAPVVDGNLLDYDTQSVEVSLDGWQASNAALTRIPGYLVSGTGYMRARSSSSAAGTVTLSTTDSAPVVPGTEYVSYAMVGASGADYPCGIELRWLDGADAVVATERRESTAEDGQTERLCVVGTAPAGAVAVRLAVDYDASASGQVLYLDECSIAVAPNFAGNLLTYDEYSNESLVPQWDFDGATYASTSLTGYGITGYFGVQIVPEETGIFAGYLHRLIPVTPGTTYVARATTFRYVPDSSSVTWGRRSRIEWYDEDENLLLADVPDQFSTLSGSGTVTGGWNSTTRTAPEGAAFARLGVEIDHVSEDVSSYLMDGVIFAESSPEYTLSTDDETASVSLTVFFQPPDELPMDYITVERFDEDGTSTPVRTYGGDAVALPYSPGTMVFEDYEAPLGTRIWYRIRWTRDADTIAVTISTRTIDSPTLADGDFVWLKSPGIPAVNTRVMMEAPPAWSRAARSATYDVIGRRNPIQVSSERSGRKASVSVLVWDEAEHYTLDALLDSGLPALIQAMPGYGLPGNLYVSIGDATAESVTGEANTPGWRWAFEITEIDRPYGGLQGSALSTWQTVLDNYDTWEDVFDAFDTWADVLTEV